MNRLISAIFTTSALIFGVFFSGRRQSHKRPAILSEHGRSYHPTLNARMAAKTPRLVQIR
jgi:hypothetical protein